MAEGFRAVILAPLDTSGGGHLEAISPARWKGVASEAWEDAPSFKPVLGEPRKVPIPASDLEAVVAYLAKLDASLYTDEDVSTGADCIVFPVGIAVARLFVVVLDVRAFLIDGSRSVDDENLVDDWLSGELFRIARSVLAPLASAERRDAATARETPFLYTVIETDGHVNDEYGSDATQREAELGRSAAVPVPLRLGPRMMVWVGWNTAQVVRIPDDDHDPSLWDLLGVFVIRSACWMLLDQCNRDAVRALSRFEERDGRDVTIETVATELRRLQIAGARTLSAYHQSLWTLEVHQTALFGMIDETWDDDVDAMRELLTAVRNALEAERDALLRREAEAAEKRERTLAIGATSLAVLSLVSAVVDTYSLVGDRLSSRLAALGVAVLIPSALLAGFLLLVTGLLKRKRT